jgi:polyisoprenoid-binding protein YceI
MWILPSTAKVQFTVDGLMGIDCNGTLDFTKAHLDFDPNKPAAGHMEVVLPVASINTHVAKRDKHLKSADFFDEAKYPTISFTSSSIQKSGNGYVVTGFLKMKDVNKAVTIPFTFIQNGTKATFEGNFTIDRMEYKVGENEKTGIGNEVRVTLRIPVEGAVGEGNVGSGH